MFAGEQDRRFPVEAGSEVADRVEADPARHVAAVERRFDFGGAVARRLFAAQDAEVCGQRRRTGVSESVAGSLSLPTTGFQTPVAAAAVPAKARRAAPTATRRERRGPATRRPSRPGFTVRRRRRSASAPAPARSLRFPWSPWSVLSSVVVSLVGGGRPQGGAQPGQPAADPLAHHLLGAAEAAPGVVGDDATADAGQQRVAGDREQPGRGAGPARAGGIEAIGRFQGAGESLGREVGGQLRVAGRAIRKRRTKRSWRR